MWQVDVVTETRGFESLRAEWTALVDRCPQATVFQSFEWLYAWWGELGSRGLGRSLHLVTVRDDDGTLVGLAPMMKSRSLISRVSFLGTGVSDYHDVIAEPDRGRQVCAAIYGYLSSSKSWQIADFSQLREGSLLRANPPGKGFCLVWQDFELERCPYLPFPTEPTADANWQALLKQYSRKMRSHIGYYERKLRALYEVDIGYIDDERMIDEAMSALFELHRRRWNKRWLPGVLGGASMQQFHRRAARELVARGALRLHYIKLDGQYQALLYCFAFHDRTCYYQGGFEPTLARLSLGSVLTASAIRQAVEEGRSEFDFLRGDEPYKQRWTQGQARFNARRLVAKSGTAYLAFATLECRIASAIEMRLKEFMHHVYSKEPRSRRASASQEPEGEA